MIVHFCKWLIPGYPSGLIFDLTSCKNFSSSWKLQFSRMTGVSFPENETVNNMDESVVFGFMLAKFFAEVRPFLSLYFLFFFFSFLSFLSFVSFFRSFGSFLWFVSFVSFSFSFSFSFFFFQLI